MTEGWVHREVLSQFNAERFTRIQQPEQGSFFRMVGTSWVARGRLMPSYRSLISSSLEKASSGA